MTHLSISADGFAGISPTVTNSAYSAKPKVFFLKCGVRQPVRAVACCSAMLNHSCCGVVCYKGQKWSMNLNRDMIGGVRHSPPSPQIDTSVTVNRADGSVFQDSASHIQSEILEGSLEGVENLLRSNYPPVGYCIYC